MKKKINKLKKIYIYIILLLLFLFKGYIINIISNIKYISNKITCDNTENEILKRNIESLENEIESLTNLKTIINYNYDLTKMSYRSSYLTNTFYIVGGSNKNYHVNNVLINEYGVVGLIKKVYDTYSMCEFISEIDNITVEINGVYGTLKKSRNGYLIVDNISNYDELNLNDSVYTSTLGNIKEKLFIGNVFKIEDKDVEKIVYVKSNVDYDSISYLYVVGNI